ncbi:DNA repair protein REV1 isoform X2 [Aplysia californica]|uniref:DNA repair protein REV1 isoform X2 n=1 Tax=Aplysia californica TaxID=6500 RepID=A0ABM0K3B9_APLCA|nr:DNA repair protein REV1 isoform X2 [Aplysia californica]
MAKNVPPPPGSSRQSGRSGRGSSKRGRGVNDDDWGGFGNYMDIKKQKLSDQFRGANQKTESGIFAGVSIYVNGYTTPSSDELKRLMRAHGGVYQMYLSKRKVTHIIASNLPNSKFHLAKLTPVVKPDWIVDSVSAGRRLSHVPYLLLGSQSSLQPGLKSMSSITTLSRSSSSASSTNYDMTRLTSIKSHDCLDSASISAAGQDSSHEALLANALSTSRQTTEKDVPGQDEPKANIAVYPHNFHTGDRSEAGSPSGEQGVVSPAVDLSNRSRSPNVSNNDNNCDKALKQTTSIDEDDDDIVLNSEDDEEGSCEIFTHAPSPQKYDRPNEERRKSRVYKIRKGSSGSINSPKKDDTRKFQSEKMQSVVLGQSLQVSTDVSTVDMEKTLPHTNELQTKTSVNDDVKLKLKKDGDTPTQKVSASGFKGKSKTIGEIESASLLIPQQQMSEVGSTSLPVAVNFGEAAVTEHSSALPVAPSAPLWSAAGLTHDVDEADPPERDLQTVSLTQTSTSNGISVVSTTVRPTTLLASNSDQGKPVTIGTTASAASTSTATISSNSVIESTVPTSTAESSPSKSAEKQKASGSPSSRTMSRAGEKNFLSEFYSNSRLHHISTWGSEFKAYVAEIQKSGVTSFPGRDRLRQLHEENLSKQNLGDVVSTSAQRRKSERVIIHLDMDCFFVSVGLLARPDLRGKPVAVTHSRGQGGRENPGSDLAWERSEWKKKRDPGSSTSSERVPSDSELDPEEETNGGRPEYDKLIPAGATSAQTFHSMADIASCSYEARKAGVKNGMFMGRARQLCPDLQTIQYNFAEYNRISRILYDEVASFTHHIEAVSCDEMFIDSTDVLTDTGATAEEFAQLLRSEVMEKTGCPASAGIGPNILLARLATRKAKPCGQFQVKSDEAQMFLRDQAVSDLPGVGYSMTRKLARLKVFTCGDLQSIPVPVLRQDFGPRTGEMLHRYSCGEDDRQVKGDKERKSVSAEVNYGIRFTQESDAVKFLRELSLEVKKRMDAIGVKGRSITLKLMVRRPDAPPETAKFMGHGICNTMNKSSNLPVATNDGDLITREVVAMYRHQRQAAADIRGIGIQVHKLEHPMSSAQARVNRAKSGLGSILQFAVAKQKTDQAENSAANLKEDASATASDKGSLIAFSVSSDSPRFTTIRSSVAKMGRATATKTDGQRKDQTNMASYAKPGSSKTLNSAGQRGKNNLDLFLAGSSKDDSLSRPGTSKADDTGQRSWNGDGRGSPLSAAAGTTAGQDVYQLSLSQIDTEVLDELPPDIAQEILGNLEAQRQRRLTARPERPASPKTSTGVLPTRENTAHAVRSGSEDVSALPSFSQLDMDCFEALPAQLQEEIKNEYSRQQARTETGHSSTAGHKHPIQGRSHQQKSPIKASNTFKVPTYTKRRGRPPGKSKLKFVDSRRTKAPVPVQTPVMRQSNGSGTTGKDDDDVILVSSDGHKGHSETNCGDLNVGGHSLRSSDDGHATTCGPSTSTHDERGSDIKEMPVTLCGAQGLVDVRNLLKEWMDSVPVPQEDDLDLVKEYLATLVVQHNLEQVFYLLKFLSRVVKEQGRAEWQRGTQEIRTHVQSVVCGLHGATLKLK